MANGNFDLEACFKVIQRENSSMKSTIEYLALENSRLNEALQKSKNSSPVNYTNADPSAHKESELPASNRTSASDGLKKNKFIKRKQPKFRVEQKEYDLLCNELKLLKKKYTELEDTNSELVKRIKVLENAGQDKCVFKENSSFENRRYSFVPVKKAALFIRKKSFSKY